MKPCPKCQGKSLVTDSRQTAVQTYRRRECQNYPCRHTWTTYEIHGDEFDKISKYNHLKNLLTEHLT
jgi:transcriptional regulator NrdR family protein